MTESSAYLVVGGDSFVGGSVVEALRRRGHRALASTRRRETVDANRVFLDFETPEAFRSPADVKYAYLIAAATNYDRCETDPMARVINVDLIRSSRPTPSSGASVPGRMRTIPTHRASLMRSRNRMARPSFWRLRTGWVRAAGSTSRALPRS